MSFPCQEVQSHHELLGPSLCSRTTPSPSLEASNTRDLHTLSRPIPPSLHSHVQAACVRMGAKIDEELAAGQANTSPQGRWRFLFAHLQSHPRIRHHSGPGTDENKASPTQPSSIFNLSLEHHRAALQKLARLSNLGSVLPHPSPPRRVPCAEATITKRLRPASDGSTPSTVCNFPLPSGFPGTAVEGYCSAGHTTPHPWRRQHCRKWHRSRSPPRGTPVPGDSSSLNVTFTHHYNSMAPQEPPNHPSRE